MQEKFDEWNEIKKQINSSQTLKYPSVGKIYWCSVGYNVGREVYGNKTGFMFYKFKDNQGREQVALFGQAKHFDIKRILQYMGKISKIELKAIKKKFAENIVGVDR